MHLFLAMVFLMPVIAVLVDVKHAGGGALRYGLGVPLAFVLGALLVLLYWNFGKSLWLRFEKYSEKVQNAVAILLFVLELFWIALGMIAGNQLASLLIRQIA